MIFFFISLSTYLCYLVLKTVENLGLLNHEKFSVSKSFKWFLKNSKKILFTPELLAFILIVIALNSDAKVMGICMVIFYMLMFLWKFKSYKTTKFNGNMIRTGLITLAIYIIVAICCMINYNILQSGFLIYDDRWLYYIIMILAMYFNYFIVLVSGLFNNGIMFVFRKIAGNKKKSIKRKQK